MIRCDATQNFPRALYITHVSLLPLSLIMLVLNSLTGSRSECRGTAKCCGFVSGEEDSFCGTGRYQPAQDTAAGPLNVVVPLQSKAHHSVHLVIMLRGRVLDSYEGTSPRWLKGEGSVIVLVLCVLSTSHLSSLACHFLTKALAGVIRERRGWSSRICARERQEESMVFQGSSVECLIVDVS